MVQHDLSCLHNLSEDELKLIPFWQLDTDDYGKPVEELWIIVQKLVWTLQEQGERKKKAVRDLCHYQSSDIDEYSFSVLVSHKYWQCYQNIRFACFNFVLKMICHCKHICGTMSNNTNLLNKVSRDITVKFLQQLSCSLCSDLQHISGQGQGSYKYANTMHLFSYREYKKNIS